MSVSKAASNVVSITKKQTVQSTGIWETLRRAVSIDPNRSNGVPLNPYFRNPTPGANDPHAYDDPVTIPAADIADNPYWKRDSRRSYPRPSAVTQADVVGLLSVGSAARPKLDLVGDAGERQLVAAREEGQTAGLARHLVKAPQDAANELFVGGLPPTPAGNDPSSGRWDVHRYEIVGEPYGEGYSCRTFK
ncbi:NADH-ubiquinone oxidoreductase 21.3 kDa subunit [Geosmithia morbida]|uniref:NADH-ubiquinone oxidoreductase 21.3 kDa subunit n=1 Tax=Geosmithia morbida TaxID=1094350 RepID=A0A9P4YQW8_9HYPO|nr:NADH-ubiquinone oxidoreductase 21.3 kDa subunit [Geosmithia morbida]KAF4119966.1 NADH-ubiquinone oxidoreductase 21.3 kDa subunit [Geosmithia morbida]